MPPSSFMSAAMNLPSHWEVTNHLYSLCACPEVLLFQCCGSKHDLEVFTWVPSAPTKEAVFSFTLSRDSVGPITGKHVRIISHPCCHCYAPGLPKMTDPLKEPTFLPNSSRHTNRKVNSRPGSLPPTPPSRCSLAVTKGASLDSPQAKHMGLLVANGIVSTKERGGAEGMSSQPCPLRHLDKTDTQSHLSAASSTSHFTIYFITGSSNTQTISPMREFFPERLIPCQHLPIVVLCYCLF